MSLLFMDGMDYYDTVDDFEKKWDDRSSGFWDPSQGRFGKGSFRFRGTPASRDWIRTVFPSRSTVVFGFAYKASDPHHNKIIARLGVGGSGGGPSLIVMEDGVLAFADSRSWPTRGSRVSDTSLEALNTEAWYYIEVKITAGPTGRAIVRVNEEVWLDDTFDTRPKDSATDYNDLYLGTHSSGRSGQIGDWVDDCYLLDTQGTRLNDFLGDVRIETLLPTADEQTDFTPKISGPNFEMIDETALDEEGTWNESASLGDRDLFIFEDIGASPEEIFAIQVSAAARKTDAGTRQIGAVVRDPDGNVDQAAPHGLITDYLYERFIYETNPFTGSPWTEQEVNSLDVGYEVPSS